MKCYIDSVVVDSRIQADDIRELIPDALLRRRMSRLLRTAVATAVSCVGGVENIASLDAIITATGWGCLTDSERFLRNMISEDEQLLNPTPFIQSTFNTVGGIIALMGKNHCYNMTYVNRSHSFEDALLDSIIRVADGSSRNLLVGAFDEQTQSQYRIMERMGVFRSQSPGEGSVFVRILSEKSQSSLAQLVRLDFPGNSLNETEVLERYATSSASLLLFNSYRDKGLFPTASAHSFARAVELIRRGESEVVVYNEYLGATPTVSVVQCVG